MSSLLSRRSVRWIPVGLMFIFCAYGALRLANSLNDKANLAKVIDNIHLLTKTLEVYAIDNGRFPEDLQSLVTEMHLDERLLSSAAGEKLEYFRPDMTSAGTTIVLVVTIGSHRIEVNKNFERRQSP